MRLKIMYFLDDGLGFGGAANTLLQQAVLMRKSGHKILISISNEKKEKIAEEYFDICKKINIDIIRLPFQISSQPEDIDIISVIQNYSTVKNAVENFLPNLMHSMQINPVVELISRELKIPHIMNIYQIQECFFSVRYTDLFPHYHICDSWYYANKWTNLICTDSVCIRTVANRPIHTRTIDKDSGFARYCCVGGMYMRKNQLEVIKAFEMAISKGLKGELIFYGYDNTSYAIECKKYLEEKNLSKFIKIAGFCSSMDEEYEKADVLLCGSTCESYPNAISEALAHGLPVISTPVAGVPEVIVDGYNGYLCDGYSKKEIYQKIMQFEKERRSDKLAEILQHAGNTYEKLHSPESVSSELIKYYYYVLNDNHKASKTGIEDIRRNFLKLIQLYDNHYDTFVHPEMVRLKLWYIYHIESILKGLVTEKERRVYIWGAGRLAPTVKRMLEIFFPFLKIQGFIDNHKQGKLFDLPVYPSHLILTGSHNIIFVGLTNGQEEVLQILKESDRIYNQDYFVVVPRIW